MKLDKENIYAELLTIQFRKGDIKAFQEIVRIWGKRLFYFTRRLVESEEAAWDSLQETWVSVYKSIHTLKDTGKLVPWLYKIARNKAMSHMRKEWKHYHFEEVLEYPLENQSNNHWLEEENARQVHSALSKISLPHREVLTLHFLENFTLEEISQILEVPTGTIKSRLHYAKLALREVMDKEV